VVEAARVAVLGVAAGTAVLVAMVGAQEVARAVTGAMMHAYPLGKRHTGRNHSERSGRTCLLRYTMFDTTNWWSPSCRQGCRLQLIARVQVRSRSRMPCTRTWSNASRLQLYHTNLGYISGAARQRTSVSRARRRALQLECMAGGAARSTTVDASVWVGARS